MRHVAIVILTSSACWTGVEPRAPRAVATASEPAPPATPDAASPPSATPVSPSIYPAAPTPTVDDRSEATPAPSVPVDDRRAAMSLDPAPAPAALPGIHDRPFAPYAMVRLGRYGAFGGTVDETIAATDYASGPTVFWLGAGARVNDITGSLVFGIGGGTASEEAQAPIAAAGATPSDVALAIFFGLEGEYRWRRYHSKYTPFVGGMVAYGVVMNGGDFDDRHRVSLSHSGLHLRGMGGIDLLTNSWFGLGIQAELGFTSYGNTQVTMTTDDDILTFENESYSETHDTGVAGGTALYGGIAIRAVFFP